MDGWIDRSLTSDVEGKASEPASLFGRVSVTPRSPHSHSLAHASVPSLRERKPSHPHDTTLHRTRRQRGGVGQAGGILVRVQAGAARACIRPSIHLTDRRASKMSTDATDGWTDGEPTISPFHFLSLSLSLSFLLPSISSLSEFTLALPPMASNDAHHDRELCAGMGNLPFQILHPRFSHFAVRTVVTAQHRQRKRRGAQLPK